MNASLTIENNGVIISLTSESIEVEFQIPSAEIFWWDSCVTLVNDIIGEGILAAANLM